MQYDVDPIPRGTKGYRDLFGRPLSTLEWAFAVAGLASMAAGLTLSVAVTLEGHAWPMVELGSLLFFVGMAVAWHVGQNALAKWD